MLVPWSLPGTSILNLHLTSEGLERSPLYSTNGHPVWQSNHSGDEKFVKAWTISNCSRGQSVCTICMLTTIFGAIVIGSEKKVLHGQLPFTGATALLPTHRHYN